MQMIDNGLHFKNVILIRPMSPFKFVAQLEFEEMRMLKS